MFAAGDCAAAGARQAASEIQLDAAERQRHPRFPQIDGDRGRRENVAASRRMNINDAGIVETEFIKPPARIAPGCLQRQELGIIIQAEA